MAISRKVLHEIIDRISEDRLPEISDLLNRIYEEEKEELAAGESLEIDAAKQRISEGKYATFEEVFGDLE